MEYASSVLRGPIPEMVSLDLHWCYLTSGKKRT
jgi:hypothetical protein